MIKSDAYYHRLQINKTLKVPTISEIKQSLKEPLAALFFKTCPEKLKPIVGLTPPLQGPGNSLWVSPSDLLSGIVKLKPPLTCKHVAALTHQGILEIGKVIEDKLMKEWEAEKKKDMEEQEEVLLFKFARDKQQAIEYTIEKQEKQCSKMIQNLIDDYNIKIEKLSKVIHRKAKENCEQLMKVQKHNLEDEWSNKVRDTVEETVRMLTVHFLEEMKIQAEKLKQHCAKELCKEETRGKNAVLNERHRGTEILNQLKHKMECANIANLMYILSVERRKCQEEKESLEWEYKQRMLELERFSKESSIKIKELEAKTEAQCNQINMREECFLEIIRQFQKFINFALKAVPTQAEFLLNVDKLMLYELKQTLQKCNPKRAQRIMMGIRKWKSESIEVNDTPICNLKLKDYHACNEEIDVIPDDAASLKSMDDLPAFLYNENLYVREDFRNMISQGITVSKNSMLWNKDVENLVNILRVSTSRDSTTIHVTESKNANVRFSNHEAHTINSKNNLKDFKTKTEENIEILSQDLKHSVNTEDTENKTDNSVLIRAERNNVDNFTVDVQSSSQTLNNADKLIPLNKEAEDDIQVFKEPGSLIQKEMSKLSLACDSLEMIRRSRANSAKASQISRYVPMVSANSNNKVQKKIVDIVDTENNKSSESKRPSLNSLRKPSKLSMARNSLELIKNSILSLRSQQKDSLKNESIELYNSPLNEKISSRKPDDDVLSVKSVHLSFIEVTHIPDADVNRKIERKKKSSKKLLQHQQLPFNIYRENELSKEKIIKPSKNAKSSSIQITRPTVLSSVQTKTQQPLPELIKTSVRIAGEKTGKEHLQANEEFTLLRIDSMINLLHKNPSLRRMFTSVTK